MSIDLFTFFAQMFNLLLLLYLLRRFLYLPVLKAVDERQKFIERELKKAASSHKEALRLEAECKQKMAEIDAQKQDILSQTRAEAAVLAEKLANEAKAQFEADKSQWKQRLAGEQKTFELAMQNLIWEHFNKLADGALKQMADVSLNDLMIDKLKEKISAWPVRKKQEFAAAYQNKKQLFVRSAQKISAEQKQKVKDFLRVQLELPEDTKFKFEVDKKLVCGVALQADEQLIDWNLASYMNEFQKNMQNDVQQLINRG